MGQAGAGGEATAGAGGAPPVCPQGETRCTGKTAEVCGSDGWETTETCPFLCSAGTCKGECNPGAAQCNGTSAQSCDETGTWKTTESCAFVCAAGACVGGCLPGTHKCDGLKAETCSAQGAWQEDATCPFLCQNGGCTGSCVPGTTQCSGAGVQTCSAQGQWSAAASCPGVDGASSACNAGACVFTCTAGNDDCDGKPSNGCEAQLSEDPANCGGCGIDCGGASCSGGKCGAALIVQGTNIGNLALDEGNVYWIERGAGPGKHAIYRTAKSGGSSALVQGDITLLRDLATDGASVFWSAGGQVARVPVTGGLPTVVYTASGTASAGLTMDGTNAYFPYLSGGTSLFKAPLTGAAPQAMVTLPASAMANIASLQAAGGHVYALDHFSGTVGRVPVAGGPWVTVGTANVAGQMTHDAQRLYWTSQGMNGAGSSIQKLALTPNVSQETLLTVPQGKYAFYITTDGVSVYFSLTTSTGTSEALYKMPVGGGASTLIASTKFMHSLAVDSTHVYWAEGTSIWRIAK